jgi:hypothetical protein
MIPGIVSRRNCVCSLSAILLLVCLGACGTVGKNHASDDGLTSSSPREASSSFSGPQAVRVVAEVEHQQLANFALLRTPPEGLPSAVQHVLKEPVFGSDWGLAQRIPAKASGAYWLLPGNGYMCVVSEGSMGSPTIGTTCARASQARHHGIAAVTVRRAIPGSHIAASRLIVGLAPDGTHQVVVHTRGYTETIPVHDEIFELHDSIVAPPDFLVLR